MDKLTHTHAYISLSLIHIHIYVYTYEKSINCCQDAKTLRHNMLKFPLNGLMKHDSKDIFLQNI